MDIGEYFTILMYTLMILTFITLVILFLHELSGEEEKKS
jgi:hypothetical protein